MTHLGERIVDFIFNELSAPEMLEAQRHIVQCEECRLRVEQFQHTSAMLKESPAMASMEPPRRIVFEVEKPRRISSWRWIAPLAAAAAIVLVVFMTTPIQIQRNGSQLTIAFGAPVQPAPESTTVAAPPQQQAAAQPIDYDRIIREVKESQQVWLANELRNRDVAHVREVQRLQGELVYIDSVQRSMLRDTIENASSIQLLAQKNE